MAPSLLALLSNVLSQVSMPSFTCSIAQSLFPYDLMKIS